MKLTHRFISSLAVASMALSATPAFATSLGVGTSLGGSVGIHGHSGEIDSHSQADVHANVSGFTKVNHGKDVDHHGSGSTVTNSGSVTSTGSVVTRLHTKLDKSLTLAARVSAFFSKKICALLGNDEGTSLTTCLADQKADIMASFSAKLDAAFGN